MRFILVSVLLFSFSYNAFAEDWEIGNASKTKKFLFYKNSKVAELKYSGSWGTKWQVFCLKGRKRGEAGGNYSTLKSATMSAMSECKKF